MNIRVLESQFSRWILLVALLGIPVKALADDAEGRIYGTVDTRSGSSYTGFLRWGTQETFWDDLFHSLKTELPHLDDLDEDDRRDRRRIRILGYRIDLDGGASVSRVFIARFGDIERIDVLGESEAEVYLKSGTVHEVAGYSDDVSSDIHVFDESLGEIDLKWERIETIRFEQAPSGAKPEGRRLRGTVHSDGGEYQGFIQWDGEEALTTDLLDGESEDGDMSIEFGRIKSIERRGRRSSIVMLEDGRELRLRGSNDVDDDNRGVYIEDPRYGRVKVNWDDFDRLDLDASSGSGRRYDDYPPLGELRGTVRAVDDEEPYVGRIVYDLDESESWEILNGSIRDVEFNIPFAMIARIEPVDHDASLVFLRNGEEIELEDGQDVSDSNDGILIYTDDSRRPDYIPWDEVESVEFDG